MAAFNKFQNFVEDIGKAVHNFSSHTLKMALTNTAPNATDTVLANITQISATGGYSSGGYTLDSVTWAETSGTAKLTIADEVITASGGSVGPFRYLVLYNDTPTSPADPLIGWYDYGSNLTLADTETLTVDFDGSNGVFTLA
jgi:hypothetical protein